MSATDRNLFGQFARQGPKPMPTKRAESNDMDLVQSVIRTAMTDGYALVGPTRHAYRRLNGREIERVPAYESNMVHQLLNRGMFTEGGTHVFSHGGREGPGHSVLVPKSTKTVAARWKNYVRLPAPRESTNPPGEQVTRVGATLQCPECGEPAQQKKPTRWSPANGPAPRFSHLDGEPLCPVVSADGYVPARPRPASKTRKD